MKNGSEKEGKGRLLHPQRSHESRFNLTVCHLCGATNANHKGHKVRSGQRPTRQMCSAEHQIPKPE